MRLLLHACCAPCANRPIESLRQEGMAVTGFWFNPNIHPYTEYQARKSTLEAYAKEIGMKLIIGGTYDLRPWIEHVADNIDGRCAYCYQVRMEETARYAAENGYDCAMQLDADGQHRPEYIAAMLEELESGADIVIGSRFLTVKKPKNLRMLGSYIISWSIRLTTGRAICDPTSGMRLFNRAMVEEFAQNLNYGPEPDTISYLIKNGAVVREVQVTMGEREAGQSYLTFWRSIEYMVKMSISILLIQWFRKRDTETPYPERSL